MSWRADENDLLYIGRLADWRFTQSQRPTLCSRYATILSQLHNLTSSLSSTSPSFLPSQHAELANVLSREAASANLYADQPVGTLLGADAFDPEQLPRVRYNDGTPQGNPLAPLVAHPVAPTRDQGRSNDDGAQVALLTNVLRTRLEPELEEKREARVASVFDAIDSRRARAKRPPLAASAVQGGGSADELLQEVKKECDMHDAVALTALRMWYHLERAPDESGETYDWKMRLHGQADDDEEQEDEADAEGEDTEMKEAAEPETKPAEPAPAPWSQSQAAAFLSRGSLPPSR